MASSGQVAQLKPYHPLDTLNADFELSKARPRAMAMMRLESMGE